MDFCSECGSRLTPKKVTSGGQVMLMLACSKCGHKIKESSENIKLNGKTVIHNPKQLVAVIDRDNQLSTLLPVERCPLEIG